jgi:capsular exopolysaccharide synthesis family protein
MNLAQNSIKTAYLGDKNEAERQEFIDFGFIMGALRRQWLVIAIAWLFFAALGVAYIFITPPTYYATSSVIIDAKRVDPFREDGGTTTSGAIDPGFIESQVATINSVTVIEDVVRRLKLQNDPEFGGDGDGVFNPVAFLRGTLKGIMQSVGLIPQPPQGTDDPIRDAVDLVKAKLDVNRGGLSYVISIGFSSLDPEKAALIANTFAERYIDYQIASRLTGAGQTRDWLERRIEELRSRAATADRALAQFQPDGGSEAQVRLRELESNAQSYRALYNSFLDRYARVVQEQSFSGSEARVLTHATPPNQKDSPATTLVLLMASCAGLAFGAGVAFLREFSDRKIKTAKQVEALTNCEFMGFLPRIDASSLKYVTGRSVMYKLNDLTSGHRYDPLFGAVIHQPYTRFTETIRSIVVTCNELRRASRCSVIGVTSCVPHEGKSTVAVNLAHMFARTGRRALLIDLDFRFPYLTGALVENPQYGIMDLLENGGSLEDKVWVDPESGLHVLPGIFGEPTGATHEMLGSRRMKELIDDLSAHYDVIVLDMSPIAPSVDVRAASHLVDGIVLVVGWNQISTDVLRRTLETSGEVRSKLIGAVLNHVDEKTVRSYDSSYDESYWAGYYGPNVKN